MPTDQKLTQKDAVTVIADTDIVYVVQGVGGTPVVKKSTWSLFKSTLKTYFDTIYTPPSMRPNALIGGVIHNQFWIGGWKPKLTNGCAASAQIDMGTNKNVYDYLAFDKDAIEYAYANFPLPQEYTGGVVYAQPYWLHPATTTNFKVSWGLDVVSARNDDTLDVAQGTTIYSNDIGGTTSDLYIGPLTTAITIAGTLAAGNLVNWRSSRKADDGTNDTLAVDAFLLGWLVWYPVA